MTNGLLANDRLSVMTNSLLTNDRLSVMTNCLLTNDWLRVMTNKWLSVMTTSLLTNDWLSVMTSHVVKSRRTLNYDGQAVFVSLGIVRLAPTPVMPRSCCSRRPRDGPGPVVDPSPRPEVGLALSHQQPPQLSLLLGRVQRHRLHPVGPAVGCSLGRGEGGAAQPPGDQVLAMVGARSWTRAGRL
jgi:hypothetical protein